MVEPRCPYFGKCGGCSTQHIDYAQQIENKKKMLMNATGLKELKVFFGKEYGYRTRMDFVFCKEGLGFRKEGKPTEVVPVKECVISNPRINELMKEVVHYFKEPDFFNFKNFSGTMKFAVIRAPPNDSSISIVVNSDSGKLGEVVEKIENFKCSADNLVITYVEKGRNVGVSEEYHIVKGNDYLMEDFFGKKFFFPLQGFFQNNHEMAEEMQKYVRELISEYDTKDFELLDLYGGVGTFGIVNSDLFSKVSIVESYRRAVEFAEKNIVANKASNTKAYCLDARQIKRLSFAKRLFVITDPPRSGMEMEAITELKRLSPEVIIYVSCNVSQLAKDIPKFKGYRVKSAALFDLFPQTSHFEAVVELVQ